MSIAISKFGQGEISGTIFWTLGQLRITLGSNVEDALAITPFIREVIKSTEPGVFGSTVDKDLSGFTPQFSNLSLVDGQGSVDYIVNLLPEINMSLRVESKQKDGDTFRRTAEPLNALLAQNPVVSGFDFIAVSPPS